MQEHYLFSKIHEKDNYSKYEKQKTLRYIYVIIRFMIIRYYLILVNYSCSVQVHYFYIPLELYIVR